jgi:hypothetical protein
MIPAHWIAVGSRGASCRVAPSLLEAIRRSETTKVPATARAPSQKAPTREASRRVTKSVRATTLIATRPNVGTPGYLMVLAAWKTTRKNQNIAGAQLAGLRRR